VTIREGRIDGPNGPLLRGLNLDFADRAVTAVVGPSATGKSVLLRTLAGGELPAGWRRSGAWSFPPDVSAGTTLWIPQGRRLTTGLEASERRPWLESLIPEDARLVLLDEPTRSIALGAAGELGQLLRRRAERSACIVVTHDISFARRFADEVCLLCAGKLEAQGRSPDFFDAPPTELARRFVEQGNCWPAPARPQLPPHFHWVLEGQLAGMGAPGLLGDAEQDLCAIATHGIGLLVSLTRQPVPASLLRSFGIQGRHFPIEDMGVPALGATLRLLHEMSRSIAAGVPVAVHCQAGLGRTGMLLAAYLIAQGASPDEAIRTVRAIVPQYIQSQAQLRFLHMLVP
jgi:atypical dual specificity phosphatase